MEKLFLKIENKDINEADKFISKIYKCVPLSISTDYEYIYIRLSHGRLSFSEMDYLDQIDEDISGYEIYDYYEWHKENEPLIVAINFGLY